MSNLTAIERNKFENSLDPQIQLPAIQITGYSKDGSPKSKNVPISVKLTTELGIEQDAIRFTFYVSEFVKTHSRVKDANGKFVKTMGEFWNIAKIFHFSSNFQLTVDNFSESLFTSEGYIIDNEDIKTRVHLADFFLAMIQDRQFELIRKQIINDKERITSVYNPSVLVLLELLEHTKLDDSKAPITKTDKGYKFQRQEYLKLTDDQVLNVFENSVIAARNIQFPLIQGTLLHNLNQLVQSERSKTLKPSADEVRNNLIEQCERNLAKTKLQKAEKDKLIKSYETMSNADLDNELHRLIELHTSGK